MLSCETPQIAPTARGLSGLRAYFTGLRRAQAKSRAGLEIFDRARRRPANPGGDAYTREQGLPEHAL